MPLLNIDWSPEELGLPFPNYRPCQIEAVNWVLESQKRFRGMCLPPGAGKTLIAMTLAKWLGVRTAIITSTRGLMRQYLDDFAKSGLVEIKGRANYRCQDKPTNCRMGPHEGCRLAGELGCIYESERYKAKCADVLVTNYAYWIKANERGRGLNLTEKQGIPNPVELLVLDEGHRSMEELSRALRVSIRETHLREAHVKYDPKCEDLRELAPWAIGAAIQVEQGLKEAVERLRRKPSEAARNRVYVLDELRDGLERIGKMTAEYWVVEQRQGTEYGRVWDYDCIWPGNLAEERMFVGIPNIIIMSATLRPVTMRHLGMSIEQSDFREWPRIFPAQNTPVYHIPTVRLNYQNEQNHELMSRWVEVIDEIIETHLEQKGIIHTVSYGRQRDLLARSRFSQIMLANTKDPESESAAEVVRKFKSSSAPAILVSPSFSTGWDFPGKDCEYIIIAKVPIPPATSKVMKARRQRSPNYIDHLTMQDLVQSSSRGTRSYEDRCEVFVVDDSIRWFMSRNRKLAPLWFDVIQAGGLPSRG